MIFKKCGIISKNTLVLRVDFNGGNNMENNINDALKTKNGNYEFEGINSGDYESFCWDVTEEFFIKIKGKKPIKSDESYFNRGLYRVYPSDFYGFDKPKCKVKISIEVID